MLVINVTLENPYLANLSCYGGKTSELTDVSSGNIFLFYFFFKAFYLFSQTLQEEKSSLLRDAEILPGFESTHCYKFLTSFIHLN